MGNAVSRDAHLPTQGAASGRTPSPELKETARNQKDE